MPDRETSFHFRFRTLPRLFFSSPANLLRQNPNPSNLSLRRLMLKPSNHQLLQTSQMPSFRNLKSVLNLTKSNSIPKCFQISQTFRHFGSPNARPYHSTNPRHCEESKADLQHPEVWTGFDPVTKELVTRQITNNGEDLGSREENPSSEKPIVKKPVWSGYNSNLRSGGGVGPPLRRTGKVKVHWVCQECGASDGQWWGTCPSCKATGSLKQFADSERVSGSNKTRVSWLPRRPAEMHPRRLTEVNKGINKLEWRIPLLGIFGMEVARVLGGGLVPGSLVLVGGDPGVGKSTLLLQVNDRVRCLVSSWRGNFERVGIAAILAEGRDFEPAPVVYVSGEESVEQIANRADRMRIGTDDLFLYSSTDVEDILEKAQGLSPRALIVDSIQTVYLRGLDGSAGSVSQVRECTSALLRFAKQTSIPVLLIGHVTKTGDIAGPRVLEHIVDAVLYMEGEKYSSHRLLRSVKNRFGSTDELGVFEMSQSGLQAVSNPSEMFLSENYSDSEVLAGLAVAVIIDGSRTFLIEIQALCSSGSIDSRHVNGVPKGRADMIITVLMKQAGLKLQNSAIFLNVVSGLALTETGGDLAIAAAICSSFLEFPIPNDVAFIGEVGLGGELRTVPRMDKRMIAVAKLGYKKCVIPKSAEKTLTSLDMGETMIVGCNNLKDVINRVFRAD